MTIASEITRLQGAKSDIRQAIIDKGVDVGANLTLDEYAACINSIEQGGAYNIDVLVVGGGGGNTATYNDNASGGGGGGQVIEILGHTIIDKVTDITVGNGGFGNNGGDSCFGKLHALGGGKGGGSGQQGSCGGNGGGGGAANNAGGSGTYMQYAMPPHNGGNGGGNGSGGGGGGAGGNGNSGYCQCGGDGGVGAYSCIFGGYVGGGGGGVSVNGYRRSSGGQGGGGGGGVLWSTKGCDGNSYGGGGGGAGGCGYQGIVIIRYPTDGSYNINNATGGDSCKTCNGYKYHCFTSDGTFTIVS